MGAPAVPALLIALALPRAGAATDREEGARAERLLEESRQNPARTATLQAAAALEEEARALAPSAARAEIEVLVATAYLGRLGAPARALPLLRAVASDAEADALTARLAADGLVRARLDAGDGRAARDDADAFASLLDPSLRRRAHDAARRPWLRAAAWAVLGAVVAGAAAAVARRARGGTARAAARAAAGALPYILAFCTFLTGAGALFVTAYEEASPLPFVRLGLGASLVLGAARTWGAAGSRRSVPRFARVATCVVAALAAAFLALDVGDGAYLERFGL